MIEYLPVIRDLVGIFGVIIGLSYYIMTLRNQSRTRQIQIIKGTNILGDYVWKLYNYDITDKEEFLSEFYESESQIRKDLLFFFNQLEELGLFLREGLLDVRYVSQLAGGTIVSVFEKYNLVTEISDMFIGMEAEYLYTKVKEYRNKNQYN